MHALRKIALCIFVCLGLMTGGAMTASAASLPSAPVTPVAESASLQASAPSDGAALAQALKASSLPRLDAGNKTTYTIPQGQIVVEHHLVPAPAGSGDSINWYTRWDDQATYWLYLNNDEQGLIIAGYGGGVAAAICATPEVGQAACIIMAAVLASAAWYVIEHGRCPVYLATPLYAPRYFFWQLATNHCEG
jgi:hypothetical protein